MISQWVSEILSLEWTLVGPVFVVSRQLRQFLTTSDLCNFSYIILLRTSIILVISQLETSNFQDLFSSTCTFKNWYIKLFIDNCFPMALTGVDLSKMLEGQTQIFLGENVVKSDK